MKLVCECGTFLCRERIEIPDDELEAVHHAHNAGLILLSDSCHRGPDPGDVLIEQREGYALYRDTVTNL